MTDSSKKSSGDGVASVVAKMKELLPDPTSKIKLDDLVTQQLKAFLLEIDANHFPVQTASASKEDFLDRLRKYEETSQEMEAIAGLLAYWGEKEQLSLLEKIFKRVTEAKKESSGTVMWLKLGWYPSMLLMYAAGIAALSRRRYDALRIILKTEARVGDRSDGREVPAVFPVFSTLSDLHESFKWIPGRERNHVPRSEHLFGLLQPQLEELFFLGESFEALFDEFEIFVALTYADFTNRGWGPSGRFGYKYRSGLSSDPFTGLIESAKKAGDAWPPLKEGFFDGSYKRFEEMVGEFQKRLSDRSW